MGETFYDNYVEKCGLALSHDLGNWERITTDGPWIEGKHGNIRYIDALRVGDEIFYYYEYTREDQSHELRVKKKSL
ncbi:hypothetical protein AKJ64_02275 [candidate division MSBL1 archaeon SCGC-AAA259E17]|uniref:Uncharacterized protein n=1 Tax=candidate division MSBL1 archaeon SCGC-AAA259E17 TaxID=1698263 RepID=A0A133UEW4_9EURY|nr:hypothetical protein AKJ64_02275 [candidate division MSBL1 archaeon SCGC-AAA259E17]